LNDNLTRRPKGSYDFYH